jgi:hypothetical protein
MLQGAEPTDCYRVFGGVVIRKDDHECAVKLLLHEKEMSLKRGLKVLKPTPMLNELLQRMFWPDVSWRVITNPSGHKGENKPNFHQIRIMALQGIFTNKFEYH